MGEKESSIPEGSIYCLRQKEDPMPISRKMRSLKVYLSDDEFRTLQIATTLSGFETQSEFIATTMLAAAEEVINSWRWTTTDVEP